MVVTVSVVPLIVHVPSGIAQVAFSVGGVLNPVVLSAKVKVLPAPPLCDGVGVVTAGAPVNVAVTDVFAVMLNVQVVLVLPAQAPDQFVKLAPVFGTAVNVIAVPELNVLPDGLCWTVPGPTTLVERVYCCTKVAVAVVFALIANVQTGLELPAHGPDHIEKAAEAFGTAVSVIEVPPLNEVPAGDWVTIPGPTELVVSVYWVPPENVAVIVVFAVKSA